MARLFLPSKLIDFIYKDNTWQNNAQPLSVTTAGLIRVNGLASALSVKLGIRW